MFYLLKCHPHPLKDKTTAPIIAGENYVLEYQNIDKIQCTSNRTKGKYKTEEQ